MAYLFGLSHCPLMLQEKLTSPQALPVSKCSRLTTEARHHTALGSAGTASATGNLPSKVTVSPAAPQRAHSKTKSSECLQGLIQRPLKPKIAVDFNLLPSDRAHNCLTHSFDLIYISIYQLPDFLKSLSTSPYRTAKLSILVVFTSQRGDHTAWRDLLSFIYPRSPGISILPWENSAPNAFFPADSNIWISTLQAMSSLLYATWQHHTGTKDKTQGLSVAALNSQGSWHNICPGLPRQWDKSQTFHCLTDFSSKEKTDQTITLILLHMLSQGKCSEQHSQTEFLIACKLQME